MASKRKARDGASANAGRHDASEPDVEGLLEQLEGLLEQRRRSVPEIPGWQEFIDAAQADTHVTMADGRVLPRIRYGDEPDDWGADRHPCRDCRAVKGQYHVAGCVVERCPNCGGQFGSCECEFEGDEGPPEEAEPAPTPAQKAAATRKRKAAAVKAARTKKRRAAGAKAAATRKRKASGENPA